MHSALAFAQFEQGSRRSHLTFLLWQITQEYGFDELDEFIMSVAIPFWMPQSRQCFEWIVISSIPKGNALKYLLLTFVIGTQRGWSGKDAMDAIQR